MSKPTIEHHELGFDVVRSDVDNERHAMSVIGHSLCADFDVNRSERWPTPGESVTCDGCLEAIAAEIGAADE